MTPHRVGLRSLLFVTAATIIVAVTLGACGNKNQSVVDNVLNPETTPTMTTRNVETLISDSGIIRYRITTPIWLMYEEAAEPYWRFPERLHLEKFNDLGVKDAFIDCDSATYMRYKQVWRLDGHVTISNLSGDKFRTNQMFWDQRDRKVYSDSFIRIETNSRIIEGYGFRSNDRFTNYTLYRTSGIFPIEGMKTNSEPSMLPSPSPQPTGLPYAKPSTDKDDVNLNSDN